VEPRVDHSPVRQGSHNPEKLAVAGFQLSDPRNPASQVQLGNPLLLGGQEVSAQRPLHIPSSVSHPMSPSVWNSAGHLQFGHPAACSGQSILVQWRSDEWSDHIPLGHLAQPPDQRPSSSSQETAPTYPAAHMQLGNPSLPGGQGTVTQSVVVSLVV